MKPIAIAIVIAGAIVAGSIVFSSGGASPRAVPAPADAENVSIVAGKQIVEITAKGGYHPQRSIARAGVPTLLRFETNGSFDCSSSIRIPSLGIARALPQSGATDIDLGTPQAGTLRGTCGMGMYSFEVDFQG